MIIGSGVRGQDPSRVGGVLGGVVLFGWAGSEHGCMVGRVRGELVEGDLVVRAAGKGRAHEVRDKGGLLLKEAAERVGLEGLGKKGKEVRMQSAERGEGGEGAAKDYVRLVLDLAAAAEAAHALRVFEAHARGAPCRRRGRGAGALLRRGRARGRGRRVRRLHAVRRRGAAAQRPRDERPPARLGPQEVRGAAQAHERGVPARGQRRAQVLGRAPALEVDAAALAARRVPVESNLGAVGGGEPRHVLAVQALLQLDRRLGARHRQRCHHLAHRARPRGAALGRERLAVAERGAHHPAVVVVELVEAAPSGVDLPRDKERQREAARLGHHHQLGRRRARREQPAQEGGVRGFDVAAPITRVAARRRVGAPELGVVEEHRPHERVPDLHLHARRERPRARAAAAHRAERLARRAEARRRRRRAERLALLEGDAEVVEGRDLRELRTVVRRAHGPRARVAAAEVHYHCLGPVDGEAPTRGVGGEPVELRLEARARRCDEREVVSVEERRDAAAAEGRERGRDAELLDEDDQVVDVEAEEIGRGRGLKRRVETREPSSRLGRGACGRRRRRRRAARGGAPGTPTLDALGHHTCSGKGANAVGLGRTRGRAARRRHEDWQRRLGHLEDCRVLGRVIPGRRLGRLAARPLAGAARARLGRGALGRRRRCGPRGRRAELGRLRGRERGLRLRHERNNKSAAQTKRPRPMAAAARSITTWSKCSPPVRRIVTAMLWYPRLRCQSRRPSSRKALLAHSPTTKIYCTHAGTSFMCHGGAGTC
jgi:hypothetical protein